MELKIFSQKARMAFLIAALLISPYVVSADVVSDMQASLSQISISLTNILDSISVLSAGQQAQVTGTSGTLSLAVTSPNGGETLFTGSTKTITWSSSSLIDKVSIGYSTGSGSLNWIATNIPNTNSYSWNVNVGNTTNTQFKIYVIGYQTGVGSVTDESDAFFSVYSILPTITSFTVSDSNEWPGAKTFLWTSTDATSVDFIVDCANGLTLRNTDNTTFGCGMIHSLLPSGQKIIKFENTTNTPISITVAVRAVGSSGYNPTAKNLYLTVQQNSGNFSILEDSTSPSFTTVLGGSQDIVMGVLALTAQGEAVSLKQIGFQLTSGFPTDVAQVTIWDGLTRIGTAYFIGSNRYATSTLSSPVLISPETGKLLTVKVDLSRIGVGYPGTQGAFIKVDYDGDNKVGTWGIGQNSGKIIYPSTSGDTSFEGVRMVETLVSCPTGQIWDGLKACVVPQLASITVLSPNGGETLSEGTPYVIKWSSVNLPPDATIGITAHRSDGATKAIVWGLPVNQNSYSWNASTDGFVPQGVGSNVVPKFARLLGINTAYADGYTYEMLVYAIGGSLPALPGVSDKSNGFFSITSADITAPSIPTSLMANAVPALSTTTVTLSWNSSTDNVGVAGYRIYRNGILIAVAVNITTYLDGVGLVPGTVYSYTVSAMDAAGNVSPQSVAIKVTTLSGTNSLPTISSIDPVYGSVGNTIKVYGSNFTNGSYIAVVDLNMTVPTLYISPSAISFVIPSGMTVGTHTIKVMEKASDIMSNTATITVTNASTDLTRESLKAQIRSLIATVENIRVQLSQCQDISIRDSSLTSEDTTAIVNARMVTGSPAAVSVEELQKHINLLITIIDRLNAKLALCRNAASATNQTSLTNTITEQSHVVVFTEKNLYRGMRSDGVRKLQELLAKIPDIYPSGQTTGYFGYLTQAAVQNFQCKYSIVCSGDPESTGYGVVGPKTMLKINEVEATMSSASTTTDEITTPPSISDTVADLQAQIKALLEQVAALQVKLNALSR